MAPSIAKDMAPPAPTAGMNRRREINATVPLYDKIEEDVEHDSP